MNILCLAKTAACFPQKNIDQKYLSLKIFRGPKFHNHFPKYK